MSKTTRFNRVGVLGSSAISDAYIQQYEFPITAIASSAEQDTGVAAPEGVVQVVSAMIKIKTAEVSGTTKTVSVGTTASTGADALNGESVANTGYVGTPITKAFVGGGNWSFTLGSADFAELEAYCVVTVIGSDVDF